MVVADKLHDTLSTVIKKPQKFSSYSMVTFKTDQYTHLYVVQGSLEKNLSLDKVFRF